MSALYGTQDHLELDSLEDVMLITEPEITLDDDNNRDYLVSFIMNYAVHAAPKEDLKMQLQTSYYKLWEEQTQQDKEAGVSDPICNEHLSVLDFLTTSDVAYTLWQYMNSYGHWEDKIKNKNMGDGDKVAVKYRRTTRWTSDRSVPCMAHRSMDDEGYKMWKTCLDWSKKLKRLGLATVRQGNKGYMDLTRELNDKAIAMGYIKKCGLPKRAASDSAAEGNNECEEEFATPLFDLDEFDMVPSVAV